MKQVVILFFAVISFHFISCKNEKPAGQPAYVRKNAHSTAANADLQAYAVAIDSMKKLPCTDPRSWYFWGAMHHVPDPGDIAGGYDTLCPCYGKTCGQLASWDNCPHMKPDAQQLHFLVWHRLYTWYFERVVRKLSGKPDFAMPYWNYFDASQRTIPEIFTQNGPLYEPGRSRLLQMGKPIGAEETDSIAVNVNGVVKNLYALPMGLILDTSSLWKINSFSHFSAQTESVPHNCMHDYIGGAVNKKYDMSAPIYNRIYQKLDSTMQTQGLMAQVPSAGFDPIFFLHHANIDRIFTAWELDHPKDALTFDEFNTAGMWTYNFIDENGKSVEYSSMQQIYDSIRNIDYSYDYLTNRKKLEATAPAKASRWKAGTEVAATQPQLRMLSTPGEQFSIDLPKNLKASQGGDVYYSLEVEVSIAKPTHTFLAVMLDVNDSIPISSDDKKHLAGVAGLFGLQKHEHGVGGHGAHGNMAAGEDRLHKTFVFDVTEQLKLQNGFNSKGITVYVTPLRPDKDNPVQIHNVRLKEYDQKQ